jgi:hypothetical protein
MAAQHAFITEATVTGWGMGVGRSLEYSSENRPFTRNLIWAREFTWDEVDLHSDELYDLAVAHLERIGYRVMDSVRMHGGAIQGGGWWLFARVTRRTGTRCWSASPDRLGDGGTDVVSGGRQMVHGSIYIDAGHGSRQLLIANNYQEIPWH